MFLVRASIKRPVAMLTLLIALAVFGVLSFVKTGIDIMPAVDSPYVTVAVFYPGASPDEIESAVAKRLENAVSQVDGIKHTLTTCLNNFCQILIEFELGRDTDVCAADVRKKIALIRADLPAAIEEPRILKYDVNAIPVVTVALTGTSSVEEFYDYAEDTLKSRLSSLRGVAAVELVGGMKREVIVEVDRDRLATRGLTLYQVADAVGKENIKIPVGQISERGRECTLTFDGSAAALDRLGEIEVGAASGDATGERVYLRDIASFRFGTERVKSKASYDGREAVLLKVVKKGEANAVEVVRRVRSTIGAINERLPGGMELKWFRDDGMFIGEVVKEGFDSIWQGIILTGLILVLFLADMRMALVAFVSIPVTMVITLITFAAFGYSVNAVTMNALGISVGILVANSIVVIENVALAFKRMKPGDDLGERVIKAVSEVTVDVAASALTNACVLIPIATMDYMAGRFLAPFAVTVLVATLVSLLVSFTLVPIMSKATCGWLARANAALGKLLVPWKVCYAATERIHLGTVRAVLAAPKTFLLLTATLSCWALVWLAANTELNFVPPMDCADIVVKMEFPADYDLARTHTRAEELANRLREDPSVEHVTVQSGKVQGTAGQASQGSYLAEIDVRLYDKRKRGAGSSLSAVSDRLSKVVADESDVTAAVLAPHFVGGLGQLMNLHVLGDDLDTLADVGTKIVQQLSEDPVACQVQSSVRPGQPEIEFAPKRAVLHDAGVSAAALGLNLRGTVTGLKASTFTLGDRAFDVRVTCDEREGIGQFDALNLPGPGGDPVPLSAVASSRLSLAPTQILRLDKSRDAAIYANPTTGNGLSALIERTREIATPMLPEGYTLFFSAAAERLDEARSESALAMIIAVVLVYLLLAAILENWSQPLITLLTVPFAYLGLFAALWITGQPASLFSLLAGIMIIGVVVNAAILLIDEVNKIRRIEPEQDMRTTLMLASRRKFRPIVMSMFAAFFGMLPIACGNGYGSEVRAGLSVASIGGIVVSSVISIYFIPAFYLAVSRKKRKAKASFLIEYLKHPRRIGGVVPSGRNLAEKMLAHIDFAAADCIVEFGPGTGAFTKRIVERASEKTTVLLIELNKRFYNLLADEYRRNPNVRVVNDSAENIDAILAQCAIKRVDYIVSSLPFASLPENISASILDKTAALVRSGAKFVTFQYSLVKLNFLKKYFPEIDCQKAYWNIPPAYVISTRQGH